MTLSEAIGRVLRSKLAISGKNLTDWANEQHGDAGKKPTKRSASYWFKAAGKNLQILERLAKSFGVPVSSIIYDAERLIDAEAPKP